MKRLRALRGSYYGWRIALALAVTETVSWGILYYAFAVFIRPMELDTGWTRTQLTGAFSLALLLRGAMAVPVGIWIDRHGARLLMSVASLLAGALVILWSQATSLPMFYLVWVGLGVCMAALFYEPAFTVIAGWFRRQRPRALALITFVAGFASTIFLPPGQPFAASARLAHGRAAARPPAGGDDPAAACAGVAAPPGRSRPAAGWR